MRRFSLKSLCGVAAAVVCFFSCVTADDSLGENFIPNDQMMEVRMDSGFVINTYNVTTDSIRAEGLSSNYLGSLVSNISGSVNADMLFQMGPAYFPDTTYGAGLVIDSVFMILSIDGAIGDTTVKQTFDVYELDKRIYYDSMYYTDFDPSTVANPTPMFSFEYSGNHEFIEQRITNPDFLARLTDTTGFKTDSIFHKRFKGFYIRSRNPHSAAAVYNISLGASYMAVNYHTYADTVGLALFRFSPNTTDYYGYNQSINVIDFDYTHADPALKIDDKTTPVAQTFVQGYGGLSTYLEFTKESVERIKQKVKDEGYSGIAINKAKLQFSFPNHSVAAMNEAPSRLGMYFELKSKFESIPDYDYRNEIDYGYTTTYGGLINRSLFLYEMDITMYIQRLFRDNYDKTGVILAPDYKKYYSLNYVALNGSASEAAPRLVITYTMIR